MEKWCQKCPIWLSYPGLLEACNGPCPKEAYVNNHSKSDGGSKMEELSKTKIEQLNKQPIVETSIAKSKDGKWVIHRTTITDVKPVSYMEKVMKAKEAKA